MCFKNTNVLVCSGAVKISLLVPVLFVFWPEPLLVSIVGVASICIPYEKVLEQRTVQGKGEQQGKRHRGLQLRICVPTCDRFFLNKYLSKAGKEHPL